MTRVLRGHRLIPVTLTTLLLVASCGSTPSEPSPSGTDAQVAFNDGARLLAAHESEIRRIAAETIARVAQAFPVTGVTIIVIPDATQTIGGYGVGGFTPDSRTVRIYFDPGFPSLAGVVADRFGPLLAHELHHTRRWAGPGYGRTLFEAMISEGLADRFAIEHLGAVVPPWSEAFPRDRTVELLGLARPEFDSTGYDHPRWFFGPVPPLPRWTGYTLGYRLVEAYQASHPGATAAALVHTPASAFRPD